MIFEPGIRADVSHEDYLAIEAFSASGGKRLLRSAAHFRAPAQRDTAALRMGRLAHLAILEPRRFADDVVPAPRFDRRTKAGKAAAAKWDAEHGHRLAIDPDDLAVIEGMAQSVRAHPSARRLLAGAAAELTMQWRCPHFDVPCKARLDLNRTDRLIADVKTCEDASPEAIPRTVARYAYHLQAAHYMAAVHACTGEPAAGFVFVFVEKAPPHAVSVAQLDAEALEAGDVLRDRAMAIYRDCLETGHWPAYPQTILTVSLPAWALPQGA